MSAPGAAVRVIATGGLMLATLMNALDSTIANVALPHVQGSLSASQDQMTWVLTSYILGTAVMTPLSGWLAQKIGRKPMFLISIVAFVAISVLCGMATSLPEMVLFRLLQGCAGAALMPLSQAAVLDLWPRRLIPQVMAAWSSVVMVGPILGPALGGYLTEHLSWRWVFYINVPVGVVAFLAVYLALEKDEGGVQRPFDFLGFMALVMFTAGLQLMFDRGPGLDWFSSSEIWAWALLALCGLYVFVVQTITTPEPFFHVALFRDRNFMSVLIFAVVLSAVLFSTTALMPSMMQQLLGYSASQAGWATMPRGLGSLLGFTLAPALAARIGNRGCIVAGIAVTVGALFYMARFDLSMTARPIQIAGLIQGLGQALIFSPVTVLSFATLHASHRTEAAVFSNVFRNLGGSLGIAILQASLVHQGAVAHERLVGGVMLSDPMIRWALPTHLQGLSGLEALNAEVTRQASMMAYDWVFAWLCVATLLTAPLLFLMHPARPSGEDVHDVVVE